MKSGNLNFLEPSWPLQACNRTALLFDFKYFSQGSIPGGVTLGIFSVATDGTMCHGVDSASKNEYQGIHLGVKAAGACG
jgi:hypothetical protein